MANNDVTKNYSIVIEIDKRTVIDYRRGMFCGAAEIAPRYYFATSNGVRLSDNYYSIEKLDDIHYVVSDLHFMYNLGFDCWSKMYGNEIKDVDSFYFRFHYGIVSVKDNRVKLLTPITYNRISLSNSKMAIVYGDETYCNGSSDIGKLGCINLDPNSPYYGYCVIPPVLDRLVDFNLEFHDYAHAYIGEYDGYLSKDIDMEKYESFLLLYNNLRKKIIDINVYRDNIAKAVSEILLTKEEVIRSKSGNQDSGIVKKIGAIRND